MDKNIQINMRIKGPQNSRNKTRILKMSCQFQTFSLKVSEEHSIEGFL